MAGAKGLAHSRYSINIHVCLPSLPGEQADSSPSSASKPHCAYNSGLFVVIRLQQPTVSKPAVLSAPQAVSVDTGLGGR